MTTAEQTRERLKDLMDRFRRAEEELVKAAEEIHQQILAELMESFPNSEFYFRPNEGDRWADAGFGSIVVKIAPAASAEPVESRVLDLLENVDDVVSVYVKSELSERDQHSQILKSPEDLRKVFYRPS